MDIGESFKYNFFMKVLTKQKISFRTLCPIRLVITLFSLVVTAAYYIFRGNEAVMTGVYRYVTKPYHAFMSRLCGNVPFSAAEWLTAAAAAMALVYIIYNLVLLSFRENKGKRVYAMLLTLTMCAGLVWMGFSVLWGTCYYIPSFTERSGLDGGPISADALGAVAGYFAAEANTGGEMVARDDSGIFAVSRESILDRTPDVFGAAAEQFPFLAGEALRPKPVYFSRVMSRMNFTGFFSPFTGEANLNMDSPACMLPATAVHELAHQRGIAAEQECNFIAVLACMESGDADFAYSGALMAYIYLGNALHSADYEAWKAIRETLSDSVREDILSINAYWAKYSGSSVKKASETVYEAFLRSNGQALGMKSYGACVDLLVNYYYPACGPD